MKIIVKEVYKKDNTFQVTFSTKFGTGIGKWRGDIPVINNEYFVEIDIPQVLTWGEEITLIESSGCKLLNSEGIVYFVGKIESIEDDGCAFVRFDDILIVLETYGNPFSINSYIKFSVKEITLCEIKY